MYENGFAKRCACEAGDDGLGCDPASDVSESHDATTRAVLDQRCEGRQTGYGFRGLMVPLVARNTSAHVLPHNGCRVEMSVVERLQVCPHIKVCQAILSYLDKEIDKIGLHRNTELILLARSVVRLEGPRLPRPGASAYLMCVLAKNRVS